MKNTFSELLNSHNWDTVKSAIYSKTNLDVEHALYKTTKRDLNDFMALISPAAEPFLEQMASTSKNLTRQRFGNTMQLYVPMYLSNVCENICTYCGFRMDNRLQRKVLSIEDIKKEFEAIKNMGFEHVLLVTGEANKKVGVDYLNRSIDIAKDYFSNVSIEVQPLEENEYKKLANNGLYAVLVYQETYHKEAYAAYHPKGTKSNYPYRLETPERLGKSGIHKIGLGVLLGLEDWRTDSFYTALHLDFLEKNYWKSKYSVSFPRIRPAEGLIEPKSNISDKQLVQLICAYRIFNQEVELSLSTRESNVFRDNIIHLGITSMSAASKTNPGGYSVDEDSLEQFEIDDSRSAAEIETMLKNSGFEVVWKDWDHILTNCNKTDYAYQ